MKKNNPSIFTMLSRKSVKLKNTICKHIMPAAFVVFLLCYSGHALAEPTPGYNTKIPESIMTPNDLETRVGTFKYFDGIPTEETAAAIYNHLDYIRGVETFLNGMPAANLEAFRRGQASLGVKNSNQVLIFDQLMDSNSLFLTGNTDTVYVSVLRPQKRRPDGDRGPAGDRSGDGQRRLLPLRDRHGPSRPRPGKGRQVPDPSAR